jgi:hypothetical protein
LIIPLIWSIIKSMFNIIFPRNEKQQVRTALP